EVETRPAVMSVIARFLVLLGLFLMLLGLVHDVVRVLLVLLHLVGPLTGELGRLGPCLRIVRVLGGDEQQVGAGLVQVLAILLGLVVVPGTGGLGVVDVH